MDKFNKALEALERLMNKCCDNCPVICEKETNNDCAVFRDYKIIETVIRSSKELGIDLITFDKIFNSEIYFVKEEGELYSISKHNLERSLVKEHEDWIFQLRWVQNTYFKVGNKYRDIPKIFTQRLYINEFGKTWALTKEVLL